jgi:replicative DNA helicase
LGGSLLRVGGSQYLMSLAQFVAQVTPSTQNIEEWANQIDRAGRLRQALYVAQEYGNKDLNDLLQNVGDVDSFLNEMMDKFKLSQGFRNAGYAPISVAADEFMLRLEASFDGKPTDSISTGFTSIDTMLSGGLPQGLVVLAGRTSEGKTALASQIGMHIAALLKDKNAGVVVMNSFEQPAWQIVQRLATGRARVDSSLIKAGLVRRNSPEAQRLVNETNYIRSLPFRINDNSAETSASIQFGVNLVTLDAPVKVVIIDFAEMVRDVINTDSEEWRVANIFLNAKQLSKNTGATVIVLCQYNRQLDSTVDKLPSYYFLRYSGTIEHLSDLIMHIYNPPQIILKNQSVSPPPEFPLEWVEFKKSGYAYLLCDKHRNGAVGACRLLWEPVYTLFSDPRIVTLGGDF